MKKETLITAIVFFSVGFLAGYIFESHRKSSPEDTSVPSAASPAQSEGSGGETARSNSSSPTPAGLPEGHPPIESAAIAKTLEDQASQNPKDPEPRLRLANFLYDQKQYDKAIEWYQRGLELDPKNVSARTDLGTAYFYMGRPRDALREYRQSLETNPKHEPTLFNLIIVNLEGTQDLGAARAAWDRLHQLNPNYPGLDNLKQRLEAARGSAGGARPSQ